MREDLVHRCIDSAQGVGVDERIELRRCRLRFCFRPCLCANGREILIGDQLVPLCDEIERRRGVDLLALLRLDPVGPAAKADDVLAGCPRRAIAVVDAEDAMISGRDVVGVRDRIDGDEPARRRRLQEHDQVPRVHARRVEGGGSFGSDSALSDGGLDQRDGDRQLLVAGKASLGVEESEKLLLRRGKGRRSGRSRRPREVVRKRNARSGRIEDRRDGGLCRRLRNVPRLAAGGREGEYDESARLGHGHGAVNLCVERPLLSTWCP